MFFDNKNKPFSPIAEGSPLLLLAFCGCGEAGVLKTEDIHPPKTGISVHFSGSLV